MYVSIPPAYVLTTLLFHLFMFQAFTNPYLETPNPNEDPFLETLWVKSLPFKIFAALFPYLGFPIYFFVCHKAQKKHKTT